MASSDDAAPSFSGEPPEVHIAEASSAFEASFDDGAKAFLLQAAESFEEAVTFAEMRVNAVVILHLQFSCGLSLQRNKTIYMLFFSSSLLTVD